MEENNDSGWDALVYEQLRVMIDMKDSRTWAQASRCYAQLRVIDDMKDSGWLLLKKCSFIASYKLF